MKPGLQLRISQNLVLAPQLQQAIRLLLLSTIELQQEVQEMMESNPFLDEGEESNDEALPTNQEIYTSQERQETTSSDVDSNESSTKELTEMDWSQSDTDGDAKDEYPDDDWQTAQSQETQDWDDANLIKERQLSHGGDDEHDIFDTYSEGISLSAHLEDQARTLHACEEDISALTILIRSLDENGYVDGSIEEIAEQLLLAQKDDLDYELRLEDLLERLLQMLRLLQTFDPPGVGARNLSECLTIQLKQHCAHPY
ncbi:MAG: RNA polymerase factor sigma-54, partial [Saezia sp.]